MRKVTLYSLTTCAACKRVKRFLEEKRIPFTLIEIDTLDSGEQWLLSKELKKHNPEGTFPTLVVEEVITGHDPGVLNQLFPEAGSQP